MEIVWAVIALIAGFVLLIKGADFFVDGSSAIARKLSVPPLIIGLTIVAMGTSLPELSVSVAASLSGNNSLSVSNVVGSDLFNIMVILGASAFIRNLNVSRVVLRRDYPFYMCCMALLLVLGISGRSLSRMDGVWFLVAFALFLIGMVISATRARAGEAGGDGIESDDHYRDGEEGEEPAELSMLRCVLYIVGGGIAVKFGGDWVVSGATTIARAFGVSETMIGLTIVAFGTSLPELVTSLVATQKGEVDMAIGNVLGSNIFNILLILGVAASLSPIGFITENIIDITVLLIVSAIVWVFCITKREINRLEGVVMVAMYAGYVVYICCR